LMTDGTISRATINNNWTQPTGDLKGCFAAIWTSAAGRSQAMVLKLKSEYGLPAVGAIDYRGIFPQALLDFPDMRLPVSLSLRALSPLVPHDVKSSALPAAVFVFTVTNDSRAPVEVSLAFSWENFLGVGGSVGKGPFYERTGNTVHPIPAKDGIFGMRLASPTRQGADPPDRSRYNARGNYALLAQPPTQDTVVTLGGWNALDGSPGWWEEFAKEGIVGGTASLGVEGSVHPAAVVAMKVVLKERETRELAFVVAWYTPRLYTDSGAEYGHIYEKTFDDANAVGRYALENRLSLRALTEEWQNRLLRSSLPGWLARKIVNDASPLFTHTILTRDSGLGGTKPGPPLFAVLGTTGEGALGLMDRRLISHGLFSAFFPSLDVQELRQFVGAQASTGAVPRLDGALDEVIGGPIGPDLKEAHTDAPDAACSYAFQIAKLYRWTGDQAFLDQYYPSAKHAIEFVATRDKDGDGIPEGPSTFSSEDGGGYVYNATLWLGTLKVGKQMALSMNDKRFTEQCDAWFNKAQKTVLDKLWNGRYLRRDPSSNTASELCFAAQLAGQWMSGFLEAGDILPAELIEKSMDSLITFNDRAKYGPPLNVIVTTDNRVSFDPIPKYERIWPDYSAVFQAALYAQRGRPNAGLTVMRTLEKTLTEQATAPWETPLTLDAVLGIPAKNSASMTAGSSWLYLYALSGFALDVPAGRLTLAPKLPTGWQNLSVPLFTPTFWGHLEYRAGASRSTLTFTLDRMMPAIAFRGDERPASGKQQNMTAAGLLVKEVVLPGSSSPSPQVTASIGRAPAPGKVTKDAQGRLVFSLESPVSLTAGQRIQFSIR
jgi:uncharacterized protein (DUF608 family)